MNTKVCGQKNELSTSEIDYFQIELDNRFKFIGQVGVTGAQTSAYLINDKSGNKFVLKIPNDQSNKSWMLSQKNTLNKCQVILKGYDGDIYIPKAEILGDNYIVEPFAGNELTIELYDSLSEDIQSKIINDLASFIFYLHKNNPIGGVSPLCLFQRPTLEEVYEYMKNELDPQQRLYITKLVDWFNSRDTSDEISVMTHGDIRSQNVLYNTRSNRLAIIDFELSKNGNIYHDFVPFAAASFKISYKLLFAVVEKYNKISKKYNISVDLEKVRLFHELGIFHEYGRCAINRKYVAEDRKTACRRIFEKISIINSAKPY